MEGLQGSKPKVRIRGIVNIQRVTAASCHQHVPHPQNHEDVDIACTLYSESLKGSCFPFRIPNSWEGRPRVAEETVKSFQSI